MSATGETAGLSTTSAPGVRPVTLLPTDSTTPATSQPGTCGSVGRGCPRVSHRSMWFKALTRGATRTSSGPGSGASISPQR